METQPQYSKHASLALIAQQFKAMQLWQVVSEEVRIKQKVLRYTPLEKLLDCWITILMGGIGLVEINTCLRSDPAVQRAFGRQGCADQSTVSDTLNACSKTNVNEMRHAVERILRTHGQATHLPPGAWRVLDVDMMGMVAGRQGEGVTKGYFSGRHDQYGRQLGRVLATPYDEILVEQLYEGRRQLEPNLQALVLGAELLLQLDEKQRQNTVLRVDAGGGSDANINQLLQRGYQVLTKAHSWQRAEKLAPSVLTWQRDPKTLQREVGWVTQPHAYERETRQLMIRTVTSKAKIHYHLLISTLSDEQLCACFPVQAPLNTPWPLLYAYDLRGGGIETQNRCDQQGLGLGHRNKHAFAAQEMLVLLGQLAHNFLIWMRNDLAHQDAALAQYGLKRLLRDVLAIDGIVYFDEQGTLLRVELNPLHPLGASVSAVFGHPYV